MIGNALKAFNFCFLVFLAVFIGTAQCFAQAASDEQASDDQMKQSLKQINDLELRIQESSKKLDALEKAATAPIQVASVQTSQEEKRNNEIKVAPIEVYPAAAQTSSLLKAHTFELGQEDFYSSFRETGDFQDYKKNGEFFGLYGAYTFRPLNAQDWLINVFHADVHGDYGIENYDFTGDGKIKDVNNYIVEPRVWFGKDLNFGKLLDLTPYAGFGYRWYFDQLNNKFSDPADDDGGNNIETQYFYIPLGAQLSFRPAVGWRIDMNGEYDFLAWGRITNFARNFTDDSQDNYSFPKYTNAFRQGNGIRGSVKLIKVGGPVNYFVEPYVRYWNVKASNMVMITAYNNGVPATLPYQEDKNHTTEIGARAGVEF